MILFYSDECDGITAYLKEGEAIHCRQALRKKVGNIINLTDGKGKAYEGEIVSMNKKHVEINILNEINLGHNREFNIHIAVAPTKNISRFEWFLEKSTELGVDEITPILCGRSERKHIKEERLRKIIISASKQSLKVNFPILNPLIKFTDFLSKSHEGDCFIAHLEDEPKLLSHTYEARKNVAILIGPEGDFSPEEIQKAVESGFKSVSLGDYRLRTETAAISAVQAIHFVNQMAK